MALHVVDPDGGNIKTESKAASYRRADKQRTGKARTASVGYPVEARSIDTGLRPYRFDKRQQFLDMVPGRQLRDDTSMGPVNLDLGVELVRQQAATGFIYRCARIVTGCFESQYKHLIIL
jgi:hypothetical protein